MTWKRLSLRRNLQVEVKRNGRRFIKLIIQSSSRFEVSSVRGSVENKGFRYNASEVPEEALDLRQFDSIINGYMRERKVPGSSIAVNRHGYPLIRKAYGRASTQRLMTPWNLFRIGSITKTFTAAAVLRLHQEGVITLNATVFGPTGLLRQYELPHDADPRIQRITVRHLLQHASGWDQDVVGDPLMHRNVGNLETFHSVTDLHESETQATQAVYNASGSHPRELPPSQNDIVNFLLRQPLQFAPGTRYAFSNVGYLILGQIIRVVSEFSSYESYMKSLLYKARMYNIRLGKTMKSQASISEVEYFSKYPSDQVRSVFDPDQLVSPPYGGFHMETAEATFGWTATPDELVEFLGTLDGSSRTTPRILSEETFSLMLQDPALSEGLSRVWYGMGLAVEDKGKTYWHSGVLEGATSMLSHDDTGHTWAILLNYKVDIKDLPDLMRYAIKKSSVTYGITQSNSSRKNENESFLSEFADAVSSDRRNIVKLMIPDYKFQSTISSLSSKKYRLIWIDAYQEYGYIYFNTIWSANQGSKWRAYIDLTSSKYRKRYNARTAQGYRLSHIESYVKRRRLRYAAIFVKDYWPDWAAYSGFSPHLHKTEFYKYLRNGYRLVVQSVTEYKGQLYIAALYDKVRLGDHRVRMGLSIQEYALELKRQLQSGRILSYVQAYEHRGEVKFSAIWTPRTSAEWATSQQMSKYTLLNKLLDFANEDVPLSCLTAYHDGDMLQFTALWR